MVCHETVSKQADMSILGAIKSYTVMECKKANGEEVMSWVGIMEGQILPKVWFQRSINLSAYLEHVLKNTVWQSVKNLITRRQYWFLQEDARENFFIQNFQREQYYERIFTAGIHTIFGRLCALPRKSIAEQR